MAMRIALFSDMHANREAFEACLAHLRTQPHDSIALLGDIVGYGADPAACAAMAAEMAAKGAICLRGNHEAALGDPDPDMNRDALAAIRWTERQLALSGQSGCANCRFQRGSRMCNLCMRRPTTRMPGTMSPMARKRRAALRPRMRASSFRAHPCADAVLAAA